MPRRSGEARPALILPVPTSAEKGILHGVGELSAPPATIIAEDQSIELALDGRSEARIEVADPLSKRSQTQHRIVRMDDVARIHRAMIPPSWLGIFASKC